MLGAALAALCFVLVWTMVHAGKDPFGLERRVDAGAADASPGLVRFSGWIQTVGGTVAAIVVTALVCFALWWKGRVVDALGFGGAVLGTMVLVGLVKLIEHRARPAGALIAESTDPYSFPSGHAARAAVWAVMAIVLAARLGVPRRGLTGIGIVGTYWTFLVAWSRLALLVHQFYDVMAGAFLGFAVGLSMSVVMAALDARPHWWSWVPVRHREP
jgi:undecaprenyl-diphosphatase